MKIQIRIAKEMAESGKHIQEIADAVGYSYTGTNSLLNRNGIVCVRKPRRKIPLIVERNHSVIAAFNVGKTLEEIGNQFNVTSERVRQIVKKNGMKSRRQSKKEREIVLAEKIRELSVAVLGRKNIAAQVGVSIFVVGYIADKHGILIKPDISLNAKAVEIEAAVQMIAAGKSLAKSVAAVGLSRSAWRVVSAECRKRGIKMCHGRWNRDPETYFLAKKARVVADRAAARAEKAAAKAAEKAKKLAARAKMEKITRSKPKSAEPQVKKPCMNVPPAPQDGVSIRDYCVANKGKHTAAEIAAALGKTRNSVIGHWFRAGATQ